MVYPNLKAEMARRNISALELSKRMGISYSAFNDKANGKGRSDFKVSEAFLIRSILQAETPVDHLFKRAE